MCSCQGGPRHGKGLALPGHLAPAAPTKAPKVPHSCAKLRLGPQVTFLLSCLCPQELLAPLGLRSWYLGALHLSPQESGSRQGLAPYLSDEDGQACIQVRAKGCESRSPQESWTWASLQSPSWTPKKQGTFALKPMVQRQHALPVVGPQGASPGLMSWYNRPLHMLHVH